MAFVQIIKFRAGGSEGTRREPRAFAQQLRASSGPPPPDDLDALEDRA